MNIQFVDLKAQLAAMETDIRAAIDRVLEHGRFIMGPEVSMLEQQLAEFSGTTHVIGCSSGTDALLLPLMAYGVGPGDAVITTPFTFISTAEVVSLLGATPVFVDIDPRTFNLDPAGLEAALRTAHDKGLEPKGIIPVDLFGLPADYDAIESFASAHGLFVLEDAAQSLGSSVHGRAAGSFGSVAATSFFPAKPLGCYGDGGAVLTDDPQLADTIRSLRVHGKGADKYNNVRIGLNARLDTLQAAILLVKLERLSKEIAARQRVANAYQEGLGDVVETPVVPDGSRSAWAQYSILTNNRDALQAALSSKGIPTAIYYPQPLHLQTAYRELGQKTGDFPVSEHTAECILSLPMHPFLMDEQITYIVSSVREVLADAPGT